MNKLNDHLKNIRNTSDLPSVDAVINLARIENSLSRLAAKLPPYEVINVQGDDIEFVLTSVPLNETEDIVLNSINGTMQVLL